MILTVYFIMHIGKKNYYIPKYKMIDCVMSTVIYYINLITYVDYKY